MPPRSVLRAVSVRQQPAGGFFIARPLAALGVNLDPFLMVDWFSGDQDPFGPHPHAGFSAVSWLLPSSVGRIRNRDTLGDDSYFGGGELHWFEAAQGAIHNETPDGTVDGLQIFVNLPLARKHAPPMTYRAHRQDIPTIDVGLHFIRVVVGSAFGLTSPVVPRTPDVALIDIELKGELRLPIPRSHNAFVVVTDGEDDVVVGGVAGCNAAAFAHDGDDIVLEGRGHVVLFHGEPLNEPVVASGPFVMGNRADLYDAISRYQRGDMGRLPSLD